MFKEFKIFKVIKVHDLNTYLFRVKKALQQLVTRLFYEYTEGFSNSDFVSTFLGMNPLSLGQKETIHSC